MTESMVMLGASGAVGSEVLSSIISFKNVNRIVLLGRRPIDGLETSRVEQYTIDIFNPETYAPYVKDISTAICTLGVGQPSKISKEDFIAIDKQAVINFARICKQSGVRHFELLSSVGISLTSRSFYLRTKAELVEQLEQLNFDRLSIFQPSMIITPTNRYGLSQAVTLKVWPLLDPILRGGLRKYRGIKVSTLGQAMANNILVNNKGKEYFFQEDFERLSSIEK